jgi:hypothetical protein
MRLKLGNIEKIYTKTDHFLARIDVPFVNFVAHYQQVVFLSYCGDAFEFGAGVPKRRT